MSIEQYPMLPDSQAIYSPDGLSKEDLRVLYLASLTEDERAGAKLSDDDVFDWLDNFGGDEVAVHRDPEEGEITGMISYNRTPDRVWVSYLAVMPTERGGGVGRALINHVGQQAGGRPLHQRRITNTLGLTSTPSATLTRKLARLPHLFMLC